MDTRFGGNYGPCALLCQIGKIVFKALPFRWEYNSEVFILWAFFNYFTVEGKCRRRVRNLELFIEDHCFCFYHIHYQVPSDVFFDLCLNKRLSKQSWVWWFETPDVIVMIYRVLWSVSKLFVTTHFHNTWIINNLYATSYYHTWWPPFRHPNSLQTIYRRNFVNKSKLIDLEVVNKKK